MNGHDEGRAAAIRRIQSRREFRQNLLVYGIVNTLLVIIWAASGAGYFWPIWPIAGWGVGLALYAWKLYGQRPISEQEIIDETQRAATSRPGAPLPSQHRDHPESHSSG